MNQARSRPRGQSEPSFRFVRFTLATTLAVFVLATLALVGAFATNARSDLLAHSTTYARLLVRNLNYRIHNEFILPIRAEGQRIHPEADWGQFQWLDDVVRHAIYGHEIYKLKIWNPDGVIVYSTDATIIGGTEKDDRELREALAGRAAARIETEPEVGLRPQADSPIHDVVEIYLPVHRLEHDPEHPAELVETDQLYGVIEIYFGVGALLRRIRHSQMIALVVSVGIMGGAYLAVYLVVRRGERRLADEVRQRLRMQDRLREAEEVANLGMLTAGIAHEVRTPLGVVRSIAQTLATGDLSPERRRAMLDACVEEVDRLGLLVNRFLEFASPHAPELTPCDLNEEVRAVVDAAGASLKDLQIEFRLSLADDLPLVPCESRLFQQVVTNLVFNAAQAYEGAPGEVGVTTSYEKDAARGPVVRLSVEDRGCGISAEDLDRVFRPFHTTKTKGTGLGLAIAKKIVEMFGGTISVESRPGAGATFTVDCPVAGAPPDRSAET
ncbi:MAG: hypothetical protein KC466_13045 [Myxococcales bacterium]|nr:hypothetical protein [Myxococcales bacterium]